MSEVRYIIRDREVIEFELALSDLGAVEKRLDKTRRTARTGEKEALAELPALERAYEFLKDGRGLWEAKLTAAAEAFYRAQTPAELRAAVADAAAAGPDTALHHELAARLAQLEARDADVVKHLVAVLSDTAGDAALFHLHVLA